MSKRRALLQGGHYEIRPPWAIESQSFFATCTGQKGCTRCVEICPTTIIHKDRFGYPLLDFNRGECLFCRKCLEVCPTQALMSNSSPWEHRAEIKPNCLSLHGTLCRLCGESCETNAISFKPQLGGMAPPFINATCTGCGACVTGCPTQSIFIK